MDNTMVNIEVVKGANENNVSVLRRFTKRVQGAGVLPRVRSKRYTLRVPSKNTRRAKINALFCARLTHFLLIWSEQGLHMLISERSLAFSPPNTNQHQQYDQQHSTNGRYSFLFR